MRNIFTSNMKRRVIVLILFLTAGVAFAIGMIRPLMISQSFPPDEYEMEEVLPPEEPRPGRAELSMKALAAAYPWSIERVEFRVPNPVGDSAKMVGTNEIGNLNFVGNVNFVGEVDDVNEARDADWAVLLRGTWYFYAGGRMLPEELMDSASQYSSVFVSYNYQRELPPWTEPTAEQSDRYLNRNRTSTNNNTASVPRPQLRRSLAFQEALWQASNRNEASRQMKSISFLGHSIPVHSDLEDVLSQVEDRILDIAETDPEVRSWITNIGETHGWNWRNVAGSTSRSNHSYGIAIDILPKSLGGRATYWQWTANWWSIPYEGRYHPPDAVVKTFESYGFIWGGKWTYYDTMHFEFRPEIFLLSGMELEYIK